MKISLLSWERNIALVWGLLFSSFFWGGRFGDCEAKSFEDSLKLSSRLLSHFPHRWLSSSSVSKMDSYVIWLCWIMMTVCSNPGQIPDSPESVHGIKELLTDPRTDIETIFFSTKRINPYCLSYNCIALSYGRTYFPGKVTVWAFSLVGTEICSLQCALKHIIYTDKFRLLGWPFMILKSFSPF